MPGGRIPAPFGFPFAFEEMPGTQYGMYDPRSRETRFSPAHRVVANPPPPEQRGGMPMPFGFPGRFMPMEGGQWGDWDPAAREFRMRQLYGIERMPPAMPLEMFSSQYLPGNRPMVREQPPPGFLGSMFNGMMGG